MLKLLTLLLFAGTAVAQVNSMTVRLACMTQAQMVDLRYVGQRMCDSADANRIKEWDGDSWDEVVGSTPGQYSDYLLEFARPFKDNEIENYPNVLIEGVAAANQQVTVKRRHESGYVDHAIFAVVIPTHTTANLTITFENKLTNDNTPETKVNMLADYNFDAEIVMVPPSSCVGCTTKTVSARTILNAIATLDMCDGVTLWYNCIWEAGPVQTTVLLGDPAAKTYHQGWKADTPKTVASMTGSITSMVQSGANIIATSSGAGLRLFTGDIVTVSDDPGSTGESGTGKTVTVLTANTFRYVGTLGGTYGGTSTWTTTTYSSTNPRLPVNNVTDLATSGIIRAGEVMKYCSIDSSGAVPRLVTGNRYCTIVTLTATSNAGTSTITVSPSDAVLLNRLYTENYLTGNSSSTDNRDRQIVLGGVTSPAEVRMMSGVNTTTGVVTLTAALTYTHASGELVNGFGRGFRYTGNTPVAYTTKAVGGTLNIGFVEAAAEAQYRTVYPSYEVKFRPLSSSLNIRYKAEISDSQRYGDQVYTLQLLAGDTAPVTLYPNATLGERDYEYVHMISQSWTREYTIGTKQPPSNINHNIEYIAATRTTWPYDHTLPLNQSALDSTSSNPYERGEVYEWQSVLNRWTKDIFGTAGYVLYMGDQGSRKELGPSYTRAVARWLNCGNLDDCWLLDFVTSRHADQLASFRWRIREGAVNNYTRAGQLPAIAGLGRGITLRAHPTIDTILIVEGDQNNPAANMATADKAVYVNAQTWTGFSTDMAHTYDPFSALYLLKGDYYYFEAAGLKIAFDASFKRRSSNIARGPDGTAGGGTYGGCTIHEVRAGARTLIEWVNLSVVGPDGWPETEFARDLVKEYLVCNSVGRGLTTSHAAETTPTDFTALATWAATNAWTRHLNAGGPTDSDGWYTTPQPPSPIGIWRATHRVANSATISNDPGNLNQDVTGLVSTGDATRGVSGLPWQQMMVQIGLGRAKQAGYDAQELLEHVSKLPILALTTPGVNGKALTAYIGPAYAATNENAAAATSRLAGPESAHCATLGVTTLPHADTGSVGVNGGWWQTIQQWACAQDPSIFGIASWPYGDYQHGYAVQVMAAGAFLEGAGADEAWAVLKSEIYDASFAADAPNNPSMAFTRGITSVPSITTTSLPDGTSGVAYSQTLVATGGTTPYAWDVTVGTLPAGLSLAANGAITGTPSGTGLSTFTVRVTDDDSVTDTQELSINIGAGTPPITMTVTTNTLTAFWILGSSAPSPQTFDVACGGEFCTATVSEATPWCSVSPLEGPTPQTFTVSMAPDGVITTLGQHSCPITVSSAQAGAGSPQTVTLTLHSLGTLSLRSVGSTSVVADYKVSAADRTSSCTVEVDDDPLFGSPSSSEGDNQAGKLNRSVAVLSLAPSSVLWIRANCPTIDFYANVSTGTASTGTYTATVSFAQRGATGATVEYGQTPGLGNSVAAVCDGVTCQADITVNRGAPFYRRFRLHLGPWSPIQVEMAGR